MSVIDDTIASLPPSSMLRYRLEQAKQNLEQLESAITDLAGGAEEVWIGQKRYKYTQRNLIEQQRDSKMSHISRLVALARNGGMVGLVRGVNR